MKTKKQFSVIILMGMENAPEIKWIPCPKCKGTGKINGGDCGGCFGRGKVRA